MVSPSAPPTYNYASTEQPTLLRVVMDIPAGSSPEGNLNPGQAARIMTGAPLPQDADAVVPVEDTDQEWKAGDNPPLPTLVIGVRKSVRPGDYVRPIGEDIQAGQTVLDGRHGHPRAGTGRAGSARSGERDGQAPPARRDSQQRRRTGRCRRAARARQNPRREQLYAVRPDYGQRRASRSAFRPPTTRSKTCAAAFRKRSTYKPDLILSSAGVSVGTFDVVREVMDELGKIDFWRVNLRPGKPLAFGTLGGVPFFGLPGNPVSAMVTFDVFVRPTLLKLSGRPTPCRPSKRRLENH